MDKLSSILRFFLSDTQSLKGNELVSSLDRTSEGSFESTALASLADTSGWSDNPPVLAQHAGQGALSTEDILPGSGFSARTRRMFRREGTGRRTVSLLRGEVPKPTCIHSSTGEENRKCQPSPPK